MVPFTTANEIGATASRSSNFFEADSTLTIDMAHFKITNSKNQIQKKFQFLNVK